MEAKTRAALEVSKSKMIDQLTKERTLFDATLETTHERILEFTKNNDYAKLNEIVSEAYSIDDLLSECNEKIMDFNMRDQALGLTVVDYGVMELCEF